MSGFVAVVARPGHDPHDAELVTAARSLADLYAGLRPGSEREEAVGDRAVAIGFGCSVRSGPEGWTLVQGVAHGPVPLPVLAGDLAGIDGQCAVLSYAADSRGLLLATDRFASAPVYVAETDRLLLASTSALTLAKHLRARPSLDAFRSFLVAGYQFGTETHWEGTRRIEAGNVVTVGPEALRESTYWLPRVDEAIDAMDVHAAADTLIEIGVATLRDRIGGEETWLDLTGGYDSRLLALLAAQAGVPFSGNTRPDSRGPDVELAREISELRGWPWRELRMHDYPADAPAQVRHALAAGDGRLEVLQLGQVAWGHQALAQSIPRLLSAGGGEHLQFYAWNTELPFPGRGNRPPNLGRWVDMIALKPGQLELLAPGSREATRSAYLSRLAGRAARFDGMPRTRVLDACYAYKSNAHFGAYRAADDPDITAQLPFYFEPIFSAAFSMNHHVRGGMRLMREVMHRLDPEVAAIETTRGGPAVPMRPSTAVQYLPFYGILGRKGVNKVTEQISGRPWFPFPVTSKWPKAEANRAALDSLVGDGTVDLADLRVRPLLSEEELAAWPPARCPPRCSVGC